MQNSCSFNASHSALRWLQIDRAFQGIQRIIPCMLKIESFLLWFGLILSVCHNSKRIVTHNFGWASKMLKHSVPMVISYPIPPPFSPPPLPPPPSLTLRPLPTPFFPFVLGEVHCPSWKATQPRTKANSFHATEILDTIPHSVTT